MEDIRILDIVRNLPRWEKIFYAAAIASPVIAYLANCYFHFLY